MFEQSIENMSTGRYLGDSKVVKRLVGQFIDGIANAQSVEAIDRITRKYRDIFMGLSRDYVPVEDWNNENNLGRVLARRLSVSDQQPWGDLFRTAFLELAAYVLTIKKESPGKSDKELEAEVIAFKKFMVAILLGTFDNLYPDETWENIKNGTNSGTKNTNTGNPKKTAP